MLTKKSPAQLSFERAVKAREQSRYPACDGRLMGYDVILSANAQEGGRTEDIWCRTDTVIAALMKAEERGAGGGYQITEQGILNRAAEILEKRKADVDGRRKQADAQSSSLSSQAFDLSIAIEELRK